LGLYLGARGRSTSGCWTAALGLIGLLVVGAHFGPFAVEPPRDIVGVYEHALVGNLAMGWLIAFVIVLAAASTYAAWSRRLERFT
jgi:uncharacterized membrane protein YiaA